MQLTDTLESAFSSQRFWAIVAEVTGGALLILCMWLGRLYGAEDMIPSDGLMLTTVIAGVGWLILGRWFVGCFVMATRLPITYALVFFVVLDVDDCFRNNIGQDALSCVDTVHRWSNYGLVVGTAIALASPLLITFFRPRVGSVTSVQDAPPPDPP